MWVAAGLVPLSCCWVLLAAMVLSILLSSKWWLYYATYAFVVAEVVYWGGDSYTLWTKIQNSIWKLFGGKNYHVVRQRCNRWKCVALGFGKNIDILSFVQSWLCQKKNWKSHFASSRQISDTASLTDHTVCNFLLGS